ncbi:MAG: hypothetical protein A2W35_22145 [Chloroflexi bacterium RBG_16_57_11]|nr:MAG: hypothetical protein A2W35_22145 [Chloroflexi bacterium RBG_16_57_11]
MLWAIIAMALAFLMTTQALAAPNPFIGKWYSLDPYDGSQQWLAIGGGSHRHPVTGFDKGASVCTPEGAPALVSARLKGWGSIDGLTLTGEIDVWCQSGPLKGFLGTYGLELHYDPAAGTMTDPSGAVWAR